MTPPMPVETMEAGRKLDALVCTTFGIPGPLSYGAKSPKTEGDGWWFSNEHRSEVERLIAHANAHGERDWRYGSTLETHTHYPRVSEDIAAAFLVLERIHSKKRGVGWVFSRRQRFYEALADYCVIDATPRPGIFEPGEEIDMRKTRVAWPAALGIFREQLPEFICRAALAVAIASSAPAGAE